MCDASLETPGDPEDSNSSGDGGAEGGGDVLGQSHRSKTLFVAEEY